MHPVLIGTIPTTAEDGTSCVVSMWMTFLPWPGRLRAPGSQWIPDALPSFSTAGGHDVLALDAEGGTQEWFLACGPELVLKADAPTSALFGDFAAKRRQRLALDG